MTEWDPSKLTEYLINSDENFENLEKAWLEYWNKIGNEIILASWLSKYGDYVNDDSSTDYSYKKVQQESKELLENNIDNSEYLQNLNENNETNINSENYDDAWKILWDKHCEHEYFATYQKFCENFNDNKTVNIDENNITDKYYIEEEVYTCDEVKEDSKDDIENFENTDIEYVYVDEFSELSLFGLPTSFGTKRRNNKDKNSKKIASIQVKINELKNHKNTIETNKLKENCENEDKISNIIFENNPFWNMDVESLISSSKDKVKKKKKKLKGIQKNKKIPEEIRKNKKLHKYWNKRFSLFSLFNHGIKLDEESWFSVTPEKVAAGITEQINLKYSNKNDNNNKENKIIIDAFCGCGGNTIQFALNNNYSRVIAIDIDPKKIEYAKNNAKIYNVDTKIDFIIGDFLQISNNFKADVIFLSPPWGGPKYLKKDSEYDIENDLKPISASELIQICRKITNNIVIYLPRNSNRNQIIKLAGIGKKVEIIKNYLNDRLVAITVFYGDFI